MQVSSRQIGLLLASILVLQGVALPTLALGGTTPLGGTTTGPGGTTPLGITTTLVQLPAPVMDTDPNLAGGPQGTVTTGRGSKLGANDTIVITAPISAALSLTGTSATVPAALATMPVTKIAQQYSSQITSAACYSIKNNSPTNTLFVPWNTPYEWYSFLSAAQSNPNLDVTVSQCCAPSYISLVDATGHTCTDSSGNQIEVYVQGNRFNGTPPTDQPYYAGDQDHTPTYQLSQIMGNGNIDFSAQFVCSGGQWQETNGIGSCSPLPGSCVENMSSITTLPTDPSLYTQDLCAAGSIFDSFSASTPPSGPGPWKWTCDGTPGTSPASCSSSVGIDGACGTQANQPLWGPIHGYPWPANNVLCANGTTPSAVTGPDQNINDNPGFTQVPNLYHWSCAGLNGGSTTSCTAPEPMGLCGVNMTFGTAEVTASNTYLCSTGTPTSISYGPMLDGNGDAAYYGYTNYVGWNWTCNGPSGGYGCEVFDSNAPQPGACGIVNGWIYDSSSTPPSSNLCDTTHDPSTLASGPTFILGLPSHWEWTCQGANGGSLATCGEFYDPTPPGCGSDTRVFDSPSTAPNPAGLCSSGTPTEPTFNTNNWDWYCTDSLSSAQCSDGGLILNGQCNSATNGVASATTPVNLCSAGTPSIVTNSGNTWIWNCAGIAWNWNNESGIYGAEGATTDFCQAPVTTTTAGTCGSAAGGSSSTAPMSGLCSGGVATAVTDNGNGEWVWSCESSTNAVPCSAMNVSSAKGSCGTSNNQSNSQAPNVNLCSSGGPSAVTGTGPWQWSCLGDGAYAGQNASCAMNYCQQCSGSFTSTGVSTAVTGTISGCAVTGYSTWTETDSLGSVDVPASLTWTDPLHTNGFSWTINSASPTGYCAPCYLAAQNVTNPQVIVQATGGAGSCPGNASLNSGGTASFPASNVKLILQ